MNQAQQAEAEWYVQLSREGNPITHLTPRQAAMYRDAIEKEGGSLQALYIHPAAPQAVQAAVRDGWKTVPINPTLEMMVAAKAHMNMRESFRAMMAAAPAHPAEGVPSCVAEGEREAFEQAFITEKLRLMDCGESDSAVHAIRMCHLKRYGDDEYPSLEACFAWFAWKTRAALSATQPAAQGLKPCKPILPEGMTSINARISFNFGWLACERHHGIRPADVAEALAIDAAQAKQGGA